VKEPFSKVGGKTSQHTRLSKSTIGWKKICPITTGEEIREQRMENTQLKVHT
jgi:hypothetical protein